MILLEDNEGPDQTARMRRLIWAFVIRIYSQTRFRMAWLRYRFIFLWDQILCFISYTMWYESSKKALLINCMI